MSEVKPCKHPKYRAHCEECGETLILTLEDVNTRAPSDTVAVSRDDLDAVVRWAELWAADGNTVAKEDVDRVSRVQQLLGRG